MSSSAYMVTGLGCKLLVCCCGVHLSSLLVAVLQAVIPVINVMVITSNKLLALMENACGTVTSDEFSSGRYITLHPMLCFQDLSISVRH